MNTLAYFSLKWVHELINLNVPYLTNWLHFDFFFSEGENILNVYTNSLCVCITTWGFKLNRNSFIMVMIHSVAVWIFVGL